MKVYILRHAPAVPRGTVAYAHDDRPLTDEGRKKMSKASKALAELAKDVEVILTSPLIRAHDTAEIAARALGMEDKLEICKELAPGMVTSELLSALGKYKSFSSILVVGHEPDLGYLASALLGSTTSVIELKKGAICCIEVSSLPPKKPGTLIWHLPPRMLRNLKT